MKKSNILLFGDGGSGKSTSIATLFKLLDKFPGLKVRYLMTESNAMEGMLDGLELYNIKPKVGQLAYQVCRPVKGALSVSTKDVVRSFEENFMRLGEKEATQVKINSGDRAKYSSFINVLKGLATFKGTDYVTNEESDYGDYLSWDENTVLVVDSLTSVVDYLVDVVKANRISVILSDYNYVQVNLMTKILIPLTEQARCSVIMLGHPTLGEDNTVKQPKEKENKITKLYPKTFGQAINNTVMSKFSEVVYSYTSPDNRYFWAGHRLGVATSVRRIPKKDRLTPDFSLYPIFDERANLPT